MSFGNPPADDVGRLITVEHLSDAQTVDVHRLVQQQWWGRQRTLDQVRTMVAHTSLIVALAEHADGRIIGFCRALTDFAFRATIYDVMVDAAWQRQGVGRRLLETLCAHPRLADVNFLYLACEPDLFPFYEQWGFAPYDGRVQWMVKVQHPEA